MASPDVSVNSVLPRVTRKAIKASIYDELWSKHKTRKGHSRNSESRLYIRAKWDAMFLLKAHTPKLVGMEPRQYVISLLTWQRSCRKVNINVWVNCWICAAKYDSMCGICNKGIPCRSSWHEGNKGNDWTSSLHRCQLTLQSPSEKKTGNLWSAADWAPIAFSQFSHSKLPVILPSPSPWQ